MMETFLSAKTTWIKKEKTDLNIQKFKTSAWSKISVIKLKDS